MNRALPPAPESRVRGGLTLPRAGLIACLLCLVFLLVPRVPALASPPIQITMEDGLPAVFFPPGTDDATLAEAVPELASRGVQAINLRGAPIRDIRPLTKIEGLRSLNLSGTLVRDLSPLAHLTDLRFLNLQFLPVSNVQPLTGLNQLRTLNLGGTDVADLSPLAGLTQLEELVLTVTKVRDLTPLSGLTRLTLLNLGGTAAGSITSLADLTKLRFLSLNGTSVTDVEPLENLTELRHLDLGGTRVSDLSPLSRMRALEWLDIEATRVADVRPLAGLAALRMLAANGSRVTDLSPLKFLADATRARERPETDASDPVLFWIEQTNRSIRATSTDPFMAARALAIESIAVLDTLRSAAGVPGYLVRLPAPGRISRNTAVSAAAHRALTQLFPAARVSLDDALATALAGTPTGERREDALTFGKAVADGVLAMRMEDGAEEPGVSPTGTRAGEWRPTAPDFLPAIGSQWAKVKPFSLLGPAQFRPAGPPLPGEARFRAARAAVASLGAARSFARTADQTQTAYFWADESGTATPPGHWNAIAAQFAAPLRRGIMIEAELFVELNVALSDTAAAVADAKYTYRYWRPITAIQTGDEIEPGIPGWTSLLRSPNHPGYVSGHAAFSAAAAAVLTAWFGRQPFTLADPQNPTVTRSFSSFDQAAEEAGMSRIYGGIHYHFDSEAGRGVGQSVANWVLSTIQQDAEDRGPFVMIDPVTVAKARGPRPVMGCALDNLVPVATVTARFDDQEPFSVPVDSRGIFSMHPPGPTAAGRHAVRLTATSTTGRVSSVRLEIETNAAGEAIAVPVLTR